MNHVFDLHTAVEDDVLGPFRATVEPGMTGFRGAHGGYWLARPAGEITMDEVVEALEGVGDVEPALAGDGACVHIANGEARRRQVGLRPRRDVDGGGPEPQERRGIDLGAQDDLDPQLADHRLEIAGDPRDLVVERLEGREPHLAADVVLGIEAGLLLEDRFGEHVLGAWAAGASSLREPLAD